MRRLHLAVLVAAFACGDDDAAPGFDGGPSFPPASMGQLIAFEGHTTLVNEITLGDGNTLEGAVVTAEAGPLSVVESICTADRCGVVVSVADETANRGIGVPAPIDAVNHFLQIATTDGQIYRGLLSVQPIDSIGNAGAMATVGQDVVIATELNVADGAEFFAGTPGPVRWVIFGDATFGSSSFDVSPSMEGPRAGGFAGGAPGAAGEGAGGAAGGGGGAGRATDGEDGAATGGIASPDRGACVSDFSRLDCGGGGGGGATGSGGDGGGGLVIVALGAFTGDLSVFANGGAGEGGGGGGGGGDVLLAGTSVEIAGADLSGGLGEGTGGAGGDGALRIDAPGDASGVSVRVPSEVLLRTSTLELSGSAPDGAMVEIRRDGAAIQGFGSVGGAWSGSVELVPGLNRLQVVAVIDGVEMRSWTGNGLEIGRVGMRALPLGATLDVVYLP